MLSIYFFLNKLFNADNKPSEVVAPSAPTSTDITKPFLIKSNLKFFYAKDQLTDFNFLCH